MTIKQIYEHFYVPLPIQQHMIDVASVAMMMCEHWQGETIDRDTIIMTTLLHDLGNIVKVDFSVHGDFYNENIPYWNSIKVDVMSQYGPTCHDATLAMIQQIGSFPKVLELLDTIGIEKHLGIDLTHEAHIVDYADARVFIDGVCSLDERLLDIQKRYHGKYSWTEGSERAIIWEDAHRVEQLIFEHCSIEATDITHDTTRNYAEQLWNFELENVTIKNTRV